MMEKVYGVDIIFIRNLGGCDYSVECIGRHGSNIKLNFSQVESVEFNLKAPVEISHAYCQLSDKAPRVWNLKFAIPQNARIIYSGKIVIEFM